MGTLQIKTKLRRQQSKKPFSFWALSWVSSFWIVVIWLDLHEYLSVWVLNAGFSIVPKHFLERTLTWLSCLWDFSSFPVGEISEEDVLQTFLRERQLNGDFISKVSDMFWQREAMKFVDAEAALSDTSRQADQVL